MAGEKDDRSTRSRQRHSILLRMIDDSDELEIVPLVVSSIAPELEEIRNGETTIGFIERVGHLFVARTGERLDRAEECGQFLLWDHAAEELLHTVRRAQLRAGLLRTQPIDVAALIARQDDEKRSQPSAR